MAAIQTMVLHILAYILPLDEDEYVNDFVGMVSSDNEVFFEISYEGNVVESGYSEDGMWITLTIYKKVGMISRLKTIMRMTI